jgi:hypothetical protein
MSVSPSLRTLETIIDDNLEVIVALYYNEKFSEELGLAIQDLEAAVVRTSQPKQIAWLILFNEFRKLSEHLNSPAA